MKRLFNWIILGIVCLNGWSGSLFAQETINVPVGGNSWLSKNATAVIDSNGLSKWTSSKDTLILYVRLESPGTLSLGLNLNVPAGTTRIAIGYGRQRLLKVVNNRGSKALFFGQINIRQAGYARLAVYGISKTGSVFANVAALQLSGTALSNGAAYVKDNHGNYFYWGRRGPSVHLNYSAANGIKNKIAWFYNEVTVPQGNDVIGSYYMANGFTGGYFGMQANSLTERRILFSIWSPFNTDDPKAIPDSLSIKLLKKGNQVHINEFGSEGSGGQSYLVYPWKADKTYAFLIHAEADSINKTTTFTAYFKPKDQAQWQLIASFKRPQSGFYLKGLYSFLENFEPNAGNQTRKVYFGNQWVAAKNGKWQPVNSALFTGDATANINYRKDYSGGTEGSLFYLRNCGFFNDFTTLKTELTHQPSPTAPTIDFDQLP